MKKQPENMLGESLALAEALDHLSRLAGVQRSVLVLGERGTGKELAAERLHYLSTRWDGPFIKVNCAAMAETLLESELFGHEAGAFTGATRAHAGRFERADSGTLLLDEIGTMSPRLQEKLLRLIEYGEFERVGGQRTLTADVRVIGSTNADLRTMAERGEFRADLLDRLSFDVVHMPALRQRDDDVLILAQHFAVQMSAELGWTLFPGFGPYAEAQLRQHHWPGNVRELKNAVERSLHRWGQATEAVNRLIIDPFTSPWSDSDTVSLDQAAKPEVPSSAVGTHATHNDSTDSNSKHLHQSDPQPVSEQTFHDAVRDYELQLLTSALTRHGHNQKRSAESLGLSYDQMRGLVRKHGLQGRR